ncbi:Eukaryotic-type low-affinity urea transporter [Paraburkholderia unamae]|uniref:urea transporter n=1 Tax=Paraburkholderia unamae TaxID=219649 RepID=UPI001CAA9C01|nr:urea transporter [Paraburkholderia unamae]CAG9272758.1 Eukaryotic-type low-affinity urea transporter [Paraburkholderia unamae]
MPAHSSAHSRAAAHSAAHSAALGALLRSLGQVVLQAHAGTGACLLAALALTDLRLACAALLGATAANVCAIVAGHAEAAIHDGLAGFNGALAALAVCALGTRAAFYATMLAAAWHLAAARCGLPALTAPFVLASWIVHALARRPRPAPASSKAPNVQ